jgi:hypothetical protein
MTDYKEPKKGYSHILELADGNRYKYDQANASEPFPAHVNGVQVVRVHHAVAPDTVAKEAEETDE